MLTKEAIETLAEAASIDQAATSITTELGTGEKGLVALPNHFTIHDLEAALPERRRARGTMTTTVLADFAAYAKAHAEPGATVFVDADAMSAAAVLNLGRPDAPGHADNFAVLKSDKSSAYTALLAIATGQPHKQQTVAEFLEDWSDLVSCHNDEGEVTTPKAIAAVRRLTIEAVRKMESTAQSLSASQSTFESVQATSSDPIPTLIHFKCIPYWGLQERTFVLRLGVMTGGDKPSITLRIIKAEAHREEMADELASLVRKALDTGIPVAIGQYRKA